MLVAPLRDNINYKISLCSKVSFRLFLLPIRKINARQRPTLAGGNPQLPSALKSLTSVFGMGTGVTSSPSSPSLLCMKELFIPSKLDNRRFFCAKHVFMTHWLSPRSISISQLHVSPRFHL